VATGRDSGSPRPAARTSTATARAKSKSGWLGVGGNGQAYRKLKAYSTDRHRKSKSGKSKSGLPGKARREVIAQTAQESRRAPQDILAATNSAPKLRKRRHGALKRPSVAVWGGYSATFPALLEGKANGKSRRRFLDKIARLTSCCFYWSCGLSEKPTFVVLLGLPFCHMFCGC